MLCYYHIIWLFCSQAFRQVSDSPGNIRIIQFTLRSLILLAVPSMFISCSYLVPLSCCCPVSTESMSSVARAGIELTILSSLTSQTNSLIPKAIVTENISRVILRHGLPKFRRKLIPLLLVGKSTALPFEGSFSAWYNG